MSEIRSYIESVRAEAISATERKRRIQSVVFFTKRLIHTHAVLAGEKEGRVLQMPTVLWNRDPEESTWLDLLDDQGMTIEGSTIHPGFPEDFVALVQMRHSLNDSEEPIFSIETPLNGGDVLGYDGKPLDIDQINGVRVDLQRYEQLIINRPQG